MVKRKIMKKKREALRMRMLQKRSYSWPAQETQSELLWRMWETARNESIAAQQMMQSSISWSMAALAALVAAISFLSLTTVPLDLASLVAWLAILFVGVLSGNYYLMEAKRMMRAGRFALELEKQARLRGLARLEEGYLWEHHLKKLRYLHNYKITAVATMFAMILAQAVPFLIFQTERLQLGSLSFSPWILPVGGGLSLFALLALDYKSFKKMLDERWGHVWEL